MLHRDQRMKGQWKQYLQLLVLGAASVLLVRLVVAPYVNPYFRSWFRPGATAAPQQTPVDAGHLQPPSESSAAQAPLPVTERDPVQKALTQAWAYLAKRQYDPTTHNQVCQVLLTAYKTRGLSAESNSSLLATIQLVNEIGVAHTIDEARNLAPRDSVKLIDTFTRRGHLLTKGQRARLKRASARRASPRKPAA
jgi:hypothetical protein